MVLDLLSLLFLEIQRAESPAPLLHVHLSDLIPQRFHASITPSLPSLSHQSSPEYSNIEWLCAGIRNYSPSKLKLSLQQTLVPTENEDMLEAL